MAHVSHVQSDCLATVVATHVSDSSRTARGLFTQFVCSKPRKRTTADTSASVRRKPVLDGLRTRPTGLKFLSLWFNSCAVRSNSPGRTVWPRPQFLLEVVSSKALLSVAVSGLCRRGNHREWAFRSPISVDNDLKTPSLFEVSGFGCLRQGAYPSAASLPTYESWHRGT